MNISYVKFIRGSADAFNRLAVKDSNTLYFITGDDSLKLYLGDTLISSSSDIKVSALEDLSNVTISDLLNQDILMYNNGQWINTSLEQYKTLLDIPTIEDFPIMVGAKNTIDDIPGEEGKSGLVPAPKSGEADFFLKGDGKWTSLSTVVADEIDKLLEGAPDALDTLQEIVDWISDSEEGTEAAALIKRVQDLEDNKVSKVEFNTLVGTLNWDDTTKEFSGLETETKSSIVGAINELNDRLTWGTIDIDD